MSEAYVNLLQWLVVLAFFLLVAAGTFAEAFWISGRNWASFGKGFVFAALSNVIGISVSFAVVFICIIALLPLMFDNRDPNSFQNNRVAITIIGIFAVLFTPLFMTICKRVLLGVMTIQTGSAAWFYALASSVLIIVVSFGVTILLGYFTFR